MARLSTVAAMALMACSTPIFDQAPKEAATIGDAAWTFQRVGNLIRVERADPPVIQWGVEARAEAMRAIEQHTGCRIVPGTVIALGDGYEASVGC